MSAAAPLTSVASAQGAGRWRLPAICLGLILTALGVLFHEPLAAMIAQWGRSETYAHGYLIGPIALWLIWRQRRVLEQLAPRPDPLALVALAGLALAWLVGEAAGMLVLEQYAVLAMVPGFLWLVGGRGLLRAWGFPLLFLLLAVPFGGFLVPPLMEFTADVTVALVRMTGVPVYREGLFFSLPTGNWSVVEACSGLRYLIASVTLGLLYAYLAYYTLWRRLLLVALAVVLPIAANGLRAYGIVMLGHMSGMRLAVGVDHLLYGWVFFGLVMLLLFWLGRFWQERDPPPAEQRVAAGQAPASGRRVAAHALAGLALVLAAPAWAALTERSAIADASPLELPSAVAGYRAAGEELPAGWGPHFVNLDARAQTGLVADGAPPTGVFVGLYRDQGEGRELVAWDNSLTAPQGQSDVRWRSLGRAGSVPVELPSGTTLQVPAWRLSDGETELLVWRWYWVDGRMLTSDLRVKLHTALARLSRGRDPGAVVTVAVAAQLGEQAGALAPRALMAELMASLGPRLEAASGE